MQSVALASSLPMFNQSVPYEVESSGTHDERQRPATRTSAISERYFNTIGATLLVGRPFNASDAAAGSPVAIVNQRFSRARYGRVKARLASDCGCLPEAHRARGGGLSASCRTSLKAITATHPGWILWWYAPFRQRPGPRWSAGGLGFGRETSLPMLEMATIARTSVPSENLALAVRREIQAIDSGLVIGLGHRSVVR